MRYLLLIAVLAAIPEIMGQWRSAVRWPYGDEVLVVVNEENEVEVHPDATKQQVAESMMAQVYVLATMLDRCEHEKNSL